MRLAHKIATATTYKTCEWEWEDGTRYDPTSMYPPKVLEIAARADLGSVFPTTPVILCDNVKAYYDSFVAETHFDWPPIAPAWTTALFEFSPYGDIPRMCLVYAASPRSVFEMASAANGFKIPQCVCGETHWLVRQSLWAEFQGVPTFVGVICATTLRADGSRIGRWVQIGDKRADRWASWFNIADLAIAFAHCRNVEHRDATDTEGPSAKWLRRMKAPALRYYTLEIDPMRKVLSSEGNVETNGIGKALHICRGHFRTYDENSPGLFGKRHGTFWVPQHTRGKIENGAVVKDYNVKAPV